MNLSLLVLVIAVAFAAGYLFGFYRAEQIWLDAVKQDIKAAHGITGEQK